MVRKTGGFFSWGYSGAAGENFELYEVQNTVFKGKSMSKTLKISPAASLEWEKSVAAEKMGRKMVRKKSAAEKWCEKYGAKKIRPLKNGANFSHHFIFFAPYGAKNTTLI